MIVVSLFGLIVPNATVLIVNRWSRPRCAEPLLDPKDTGP